MRAINSDDEYLLSMYDACSAAQTTNVNWDHARRTADKLVERGIIPPELRQEACEALVESDDPARLFRGHATQKMLHAAFDYLGTPPAEAKRTLLAILPSTEYNAFACRGPFGAPIVVYNKVLILIQGFFIRSLLAFAYPDSDVSTKRFSSADHAETILLLAAIAAGSPLVRGKDIRTTALMSGDVPVEAATLSQALESFIVLHELGHIVKGHIDDCGFRAVTLGDTTIEAYSLSRDQEFEADLFAADAIFRKTTKKASLSLTAGLLFRFFDLIERITRSTPTTHPAALARWERIKSRFALEDEEWARALDESFDFFASAIVYEDA